MEIKKIVKDHIAPIVLATTITSSVLSSMPLSVKAEEAEEESITAYSSDNLSVSKVFDTKEEALEWLNDKKKVISAAYEITGYYVTEVKGEVIKTETYVINETFDTKEKALKRYEELKKLGICNLEISESTKTEEYKETVTVNKTFKTMEELESYKASLEGKNNLNLTISTVNNDWVLGEEEKVKDIVCLSEEELEEAISNIKAEIKDTETNNITYDVRVETEKVDTLVPSTITKETFSKEFDTKEEAEAFILEKQEEVSNNSDISYEFGEVTEKTVFSHNEIVDIEEVFDTKEELDNFLNNLTNEGYEITDISETIIEEKEEVSVETGNILINSSSKAGSNSHYEVSGNFIIIKQASGSVAVWTPYGLNQTQMDSFKESYLNGNYDPSIKSDTNFVFICGSGEFDLSVIASNWGVYNINYSGGIITMDCSSDKISHLNYGYFEKEKINQEQTVERYQLTAKKVVPVNKTVYNLEYTLNTQNYDTKTEYVAHVYKTPKTRETGYNLSGSYEIIHELESTVYNLKGNVVKETYDVDYKAIINFSRSKENEKPCPDPENPKTGDDRNIRLYGAALAGSVIGLIGAKRKIKKKLK